ncbi:MAG: hypothetical protein ACE5E0_02255 [Terriglobia bacterium]
MTDPRMKSRDSKVKAILSLIATLVLISLLTIPAGRAAGQFQTRVTVTETEASDDGSSASRPKRNRAFPPGGAGLDGESSEGSANGEVLEERLGKQKERVNKLIDRAVNFLSKAKQRVARVKHIDSALKDAIITEADAGIAALNAKRTEVDEAADLEALKDVALEVRQAWREIRFNMRKLVREALESRITEIIAKAGAISARIHEKLDAAADSNKKANLVKRTKVFDAHLADAKDSFEQAQEAFDDAKTGDGSNGAFAQSRTHIRKTLVSLKKAHAVLKSVGALTKR